MKRTIQSLLMLVALWGALLTIALYQGWEMPDWLASASTDKPRKAREQRSTSTSVPDAIDTHATGAEPRSAPVTSAPASPTRPSVETEDDASITSLSRYRVCASAAPVLSILWLADRHPLFAVHCGDALHVIGLVATQPTRLARLALPMPNPQESFVPTRVIGADINADGQNDLVLPLLAVNAYQQPNGRGVFALLRGVDGGFRSGTRMIAGSPLQALAGSLDTLAGNDVVMLHATDQSVRKPREAWWISGGAAPRRSVTSKLSTGSEQLALADLDRDGHLDLVALSSSEQRLDVVFNHGDGVEPALQLPAPQCDALTVADVNGDAHADVICTGAQNHLLAARSDRDVTLAPMSFGGERVSSLHSVDVNADGKLDLVGYAHPQLVRLEQGSDLTFEPRLIAELQGVSFSPITVQALSVDEDRALDLVMLGRAPGDDQGVDLVIVSDVHRHAQLHVQSEATALRDAPLLLTPLLP